MGQVWVSFRKMPREKKHLPIVHAALPVAHIIQITTFLDVKFCNVLGSAFFARNDFTSANFSPTCPANFKASEQVCISSACPCTSEYSCRGKKVLDN